MKDLLINMRIKLDILASRLTIYRFLQTFLGSWLIALGAHIMVPFYPIPMTLQTFSVALISLVSPLQVAIGSVIFFTSYAAMGIPVLAGGNTGIAGLLGPTAGYIIGFFFMAGTISLLMKHYPNSSRLTRFLFTLLGGFIVFLLGIARLALLFGWDIAIKMGLWPFILSEAVKFALAAYLSVLIQNKYLKK